MYRRKSSSLLFQLTLLVGLSILVASKFAKDDDRDGLNTEDDDVELLEDILLNAGDAQSLLSALSQLRGQWPFKDKTQCKQMKTLDRDYHRFKTRGYSYSRDLEVLRRVSRCGEAATLSDDDRQRSDSELREAFSDHLLRDSAVEKRRKKRSRRERTSINEDAEQEWSDWRSAVDNLKSIVDLPQAGSGQISPDDLDGADETKTVKTQETRVVGGRLTRPGSWPWLAAVGRKVSGPKCGGSLIADRWVITAAHCFKDEEMPCHYNVRVGSRSWFYDAEGTHVDITVEAIYRHPDYDQDSHANDVALLKLSTAVELDENSPINAICLPDGSRSVEPGTVCMAAGWGRTDENGRASVFEAREVEIPVISFNDKCGDYASGTIKKGMLCAGYIKGGKDTCQGDSGGPLMCQRNGKWTLLGLTSFGEGCARAHYPGIYTDVGYHLHWIASVISRY